MLRILGGYAGANFVQAVIGLLMVPKLLSYLGLGAYGKWGLVEPLLIVSANAALLGTNHALLRFASEAPSSAFGLALTLSTKSLMASCGSSLLLSFLAVSSNLVDVHWALLSFAIVVEALLIMATFAARAQRDLLNYFIAVVLRAALFLGGIEVADAWQLKATSNAVLAIRVCATLVVIAVFAGKGLSSVRLVHAAYSAEFSKYIGSYRRALAYGFPILIAVLLAQLLENIDRYAISAYLGSAEVGAYVVYVRVTSMIALFVGGPVSLWWAVERHRHENSPKFVAERFYASSALAVLVALAIAHLLLVFLSSSILSVWAPDVPINTGVISLLSGAAALRVLASTLNIGQLREGYTQRAAIAPGLGLLVSAGLAFWLVEPFGLAGAAMSTFVGSAVFCIGVDRLSQSVQRWALPYIPMLLVTGCTIAISVLLAFN